MKFVLNKFYVSLFSLSMKQIQGMRDGSKKYYGFHVNHLSKYSVFAF